MNILWLEDQGSVSLAIQPLLENMGHTVFIAYSITDADTFLVEHKIDCLIIDLNLDQNGLSDDLKKNTKDNVITGWVWLINVVYHNYEYLRESTIIYSDYLDVLKKEVFPEKLKGIRRIAKREDESTQKLLDCIDKIDNDRK